MRLLPVAKSRKVCLSKPQHCSMRTTEHGETIPPRRVRAIIFFSCSLIFVPLLLSPISNASSGRPVRLSTRRLREQYLPDAAQSIYTRVTVDGVLAGNAFACRWEHGGKAVCWVTQLVVSKDYRERGLATGLLRVLRADNCHDIYGIMSSHPAACLAAAKAFSSMYHSHFYGIFTKPTLCSDCRKSVS